MAKQHSSRSALHTAANGLPSGDDVHELLRAAHKPLAIDALLRMLHAHRSTKKLLEKLLFDLQDQGKVQRMRGGLWMAHELLRTVRGRYTVLRSGDGIVTPIAPASGTGSAKASHTGAGTGSGMGTAVRAASAPFSAPASVAPPSRKARAPRAPERPQSIFIHPGNAANAWHGDTVEVTLFPPRRGRGPEGRITAITERRLTEIVAYVCAPRRKRRPRDTDLQPLPSLADAHAQVASVPCQPADARLPFQLWVDVSSLPTPPQPGEMLLVRPEGQLASDLWQGVALRALGRDDDIAVQERLVKLNHQCPQDFPPAVLAEAAELPASPTEEDAQGREDLRHIALVTIDGASARDFDDAIHVSRQEDGWLLRVAIADVTRYVRPRTALDAEARERGNSWYFPTSVEPMLPVALSNGLCSLNPHEDKCVMLAEILFDAQGTPLRSRFAPALMRSHARLTYDEVKTMSIDRDADARTAFAARAHGSVILDILDTALALAHTLAQRREERGSLDFHLPEADYIFDEQGRVADIRRKEQHFAHRLIEECMIAANEAVARFLTERGVPMVYRVHPEPDPQRLEGLWHTLAGTDLAPHLPPRPTADLVRAALEAAAGGPEEFFTNRLALRTMPQARYEPELGRHFGLASDCYCHFTSPIRRYADVIVHRALKHALDFDAAPIPAGKNLLAQADHINRCERAAMEAEREITRRCAVLLLRHRVGEEFDGTVAGVTDFGCFVELSNMPVEGMIRVEDLGDDYFVYDPERQELTGHLTGARIALGHSIRVRLVEVNMGRLEITLQPVNTPQGKHPHRALRIPPHNARRGKGSRQAGEKLTPRRKGDRPAPRGKNTRGTRANKDSAGKNKHAGQR